MVHARASVVVFTYEHGPLANLDALAEHVCAHGDVERLVVDASTSPGRRAHVAQRARACGFTLVATPGASLSQQRNAAIARAAGDAIVFVDDDCFPRRGWLDALLRALARAHVATARVVTPMHLQGPFARYFDQDHGGRGRTFTRANLRVLPQSPFKAYAGESSVAPWAVGTGSSFAFRREAVALAGPFDEGLGVGTPAMSGEDIDFFFRVLHAGGSVRYAADAVVEHHHVRQDADDYLRTAYAYAVGGREFLRRRLRMKPGYLVVLAGRPVQLLILAALYRLRGDRATPAMCLSALRGWLGLARARRRKGAPPRMRGRAAPSR